jgi:hypothetical protein
MAIGALKGEFHTIQHDLESFFWVLVYLLILPTNRTAPHTANAIDVLDDFFAATLAKAARRKRAVLEETLPINPAYKVVAPFIEELRRAADANYDRSLGKQGAELTYEAFLKILDKALDALEDDKVNATRVPALNWKRPPEAKHVKESASLLAANIPLPASFTSARSAAKARGSVGRSRDLPTPRSGSQLPSSRGSTKRGAPEAPEASAHLPKKKSRSDLEALPPSSPRRSLRPRSSAVLGGKKKTSKDA